MSFIHDRRGQSVVIGTVILFGFLVVALAVYQAQVVPQENAQVEFEHSQEVENDVNDLRNAILRAGSTGSAQSQRVRLGTRYPQRTFFVNPPPATGQLSTTDPGTIEFENAEIGDGAHENVGLFWDTSPEFQTRSIQYTPDYNEFREAPTLTYEHSVVAAGFDDEVLFRSGQSILRENRISLTTVSGEVSENGVEARSVDVDPISQGTRGIPITGDDIEIVLPTAIGNEDRAAERWAQRLPDDADVVAGTGTITLTLPDSDDPYRLRLSNVSIDGTGDAVPAYIVPVGSETVAPNGEIGVEVRDEYNNPVADADVTIDGDDFITDDDGRVFTTIGSDGVVARIGTEEDYESVQFEVRSEAEETRTFRTEWIETSPVQVVEGEDRDLTVRVRDRESEQSITGAEVDVAYSPRSADPGEPTLGDPDPETTDASGRTVVNFDSNDAVDGDEFYVYASAGDDVDRIFVEVVDQGTQTMASRTTIEDNEFDSFNGNSEIEFVIENTGGGTSTLTDITVGSNDLSEDTFVENLENGDTFRTDDDVGLISGRIELGQNTPLDQDLDINDGDDITVELGQFRTGPGNGNREQIQNANIEVTLGFSDGSTRSFVISRG